MWCIENKVLLGQLDFPTAAELEAVKQNALSTTYNTTHTPLEAEAGSDNLPSTGGATTTTEFSEVGKVRRYLICEIKEVVRVTLN